MESLKLYDMKTKFHCAEDTNLGCADPLGSVEGPFLGVVCAGWCSSQIHSGHRRQVPCRVSRPWAETCRGPPLDTSIRQSISNKAIKRYLQSLKIRHNHLLSLLQSYIIYFISKNNSKKDYTNRINKTSLSRKIRL